MVEVTAIETEVELEVEVNDEDRDERDELILLGVELIRGLIGCMDVILVLILLLTVGLIISIFGTLTAVGLTG